jgi:hypothetical protein
MGEEPNNVLDDLGRLLTQLSMDNELQFLQVEKLVEVIQLEMEFNVLPEIGKGRHPTFEWSDGTYHIFISIHVEEENQASYNMILATPSN